MHTTRPDYLPMPAFFRGMLFAALLSPALFACLSQNLSAEQIPARGHRVAGLRLPADNGVVAHLESPNSIRYFLRQEKKWRPAAVALAEPRLVREAPLALLSGEGDGLSRVVTFGAEGRCLLVIPRGTESEVRTIGEPQFGPGIDFAVVPQAKRTLLFAIDREGRLWEFDLEGGTPALVEGRPGLLPPGGAVRVLPGRGDDLFLIDRRGNLVSYVRDPVVRWRGPRLIGTDFVAGGDLVAWRGPENTHEPFVASVNRRGELRFSRLEADGWRMDMAPGWLLPPGSPVDAAHTPVNMRLCAVTARGTLQEMHLLNTEWRERTISLGFAWNSNALFLPQGPFVFGVDAAGNLISRANAEELWSGDVTPPDPATASAPLVRREWKRADAAAPFEAEFVNTTGDDLLVRLRDRRNPGKPEEFRLAPAGKAEVRIDRDAPGVLEDLVSVTPAEGQPDGQKVEQPRSSPTEVQSVYDFEVFTNGLPAAYVDVRQKQWPPLSRNGQVPVSVGSAAIPAGDSLPPGTRIDVFRSAVERKLVTVQP